MKPGTPYRTYGIALKSAMTRRRVTGRGLAAAIGANQSSVTRWRHGAHMPTLEKARALSEYLGADHLMSMCIEARSDNCRTCTQPFVRNNVGGKRRKYCSQQCGLIGWARKIGVAPQSLRDEHESALSCIGRFCHSCEWDGICKDATCELRKWSPFPLAKERVA